MAAPKGQRGSHTAEPAGFEGFPFSVAGKPPEERPGKEQEQIGEVRKKPCRACTDFRSWMKVQKKQSAGLAQVSVKGKRLALMFYTPAKKLHQHGGGAGSKFIFKLDQHNQFGFLM